MRRIGILAYGYLIEEPGMEIAALVREAISGVETPFPVEFARSSPTRDGAPTVVPVESGGARVRGTVLVLAESVSLEQAQDLLWRRETRNESTTRHYQRPTNQDPNQLLVEELRDFGGLSLVLYAKFRPTIVDPTPEKLAHLAIRSAMGEAGKRGRDGISYLISLKRQAIVTPLMAAYEQAILMMAGTDTLEEALAKIRMNAVA